MNDTFRSDERLFRVVRPTDMYWKNGHPTSAAFKTSEPDGLSTDREGDRSVSDCVATLHSRLEGGAISVTYADCQDVSALVVYSPILSEDNPNPYHTLIRGQEKPSLSNGQARRLASIAEIHTIP